MTAEDVLSRKIIGCAIEVHRELGGPGLLESIYEEALVSELVAAGLHVERQRAIPIVYKGKSLAAPLKCDLVVDDLVMLECKATETHNLLYEAQLLTYLRLTGKRLGLVLNFGQILMKDGIHRVVNGL